MALEKAPRYRDAHALLLTIVEQQNAASGSGSQEAQAAAVKAKTLVAEEKESP